MSKQLKTGVAYIRKQAGMTLMEIIAALAIIAAVIVGALALFNSAQSSNLAVTTLKDLIALRSATQQLFLGQGSYGDANNDLNKVLIDSNKVPNDFVAPAGGTSIKAPWPGGDVNVKATSDENKFAITLKAIPKDVCVQVIANSSTGWFAVKEGETAETTTATLFPVSPSDAATMCGSDKNTITWTSAN